MRQIEPAEIPADPVYLPLSVPLEAVSSPAAEPGWSSRSPGDAFAIRRADAREVFYCGAGFDVRRPRPSDLPRVRIGSLLDDRRSCDGASGMEGIGMPFQGTADLGKETGSGYVDFLGRRVFAKA